VARCKATEPNSVARGGQSNPHSPLRKNYKAKAIFLFTTFNLTVAILLHYLRIRYKPNRYVVIFWVGGCINVMDDVAN